MKILICLAMSCGLTAILYFYLKQRLNAIETRLNTLTDLAQTLASELYQKEKQQLEQVPCMLSNTNPLVENVEVENESDDSDSETDSETNSENDDSDEDSDNSMPDLEEVPVIVKLEPVTPVNEILEIKQIPIPLPIVEIDPIIVYKNEVTPVENLIEVSDDESVKKISIDNEYSKISLKDLKQKVNDLGGPPLKTKQALINFLKKKV